MSWARALVFNLVFITLSIAYSPAARANACVLADELRSLLSSERDLTSAAPTAKVIAEALHRHPKDFEIPAAAAADRHGPAKGANEPISLYRGFARADYEDKDLVRNLFGDRSKDMRSADYDRALKEASRAGRNNKDDAIVRTDIEIARRIESEIIAKGVQHYASDDLIKAAPSLKDGTTSSTSLTFSSQTRGYPLAGAKGAASRIGFANGGRRPPAFVFQIEQPRPRAIPLAHELEPDESHYRADFGIEYQVPSHVPAEEIRGAYIGYPARDATKPKWYYLRVESRTADGRPTSIGIYRAAEVAAGGTLQTELRAGARVTTVTTGKSNSARSPINRLRDREVQGLIEEIRARMGR